MLVAEAPPAALDRYFYFEDVLQQDSLFRYVARSILKVEPTRSNKAKLLARLRDRGVFLIDLKKDPLDGNALALQVPNLVRRIRTLDPDKIIITKASVYDLVHQPLVKAGLPIVEERIPSPAVVSNDDSTSRSPERSDGGRAAAADGALRELYATHAALVFFFARPQEHSATGQSGGSGSHDSGLARHRPE